MMSWTITDIPEFVQVFNALEVGTRTADLRKLHNPLSFYYYRIIKIILYPLPQECQVQAYMNSSYPWIRVHSI